MFSTDYIKKVSSFTDTPKIYIESSAMHLLSSIFSRFFFIPEMGMRTRPNIMIVLSSIPGRTRRSTLASFDNPIYEEVYKYFLEKTRILTEDDDIDEMVMDSVMEEGSVEGIFDGIIKYRKSILGCASPKGNLYNDTFNIDYQSSEFGDVLRNIGHGDSYQRGMARIISKQYYGEGAKVNLSTRGGKEIRYLPKGIFATMFTGMQTAGLYIDPYHVTQGLLRRVILVNGTADRYLPFLDMERKSKLEDIKELSGSLKIKLDTIMEQYELFKKDGFNGIPILFNPSVTKKLCEADEKAASEVDSDNGNYNFLVKQSDAEHLTKLSSLLAIDDMSFTEDGIFVKTEHFDAAFKYFTEATKNNEEVFDNIGVKRVLAESKKDPIEKVLRIIKRYPDGIKQSDLTKLSNIYVSDLLPILQNLLQSTRIIKEEVHTRGPISWVYKAV